MSIETHHDEFVVSCDICGTEASFDKDPTSTYGEDNGFFEMIQQLKEDNWKIYKSETGEWNHLCFGCNDYEDV